MRDDDPIRRIEGDLARDRADLSQAIEALRSSMTLSALVPAKLSGLTDVSGLTGPDGAAAKVAETAKTVAKENPSTVAALGAGAMALLALWQRSSHNSAVPKAVDTRLSDLFSRGRRGAPSRDELWMAEADQLRQRAADMLDVIDEALEAGIGSASELKARRREVTAALAADVRRVMSRDLADLDDATLRKTFKAREAAYARHLGEGGSWTKPLVAGAAVAGAGLALAYILPRTGTENDLVSAVRDRVKSEADKLASSDSSVVGILGRVVSSVISPTADATTDQTAKPTTDPRR